MAAQKYSEFKQRIQLAKIEPEFSVKTLTMASDCLNELQKSIKNLDLSIKYLEVFPITEESIGIEFSYSKDQFEFSLFFDILETNFKSYYLLNDSLFLINISNITELQRLL